MSDPRATDLFNRAAALRPEQRAAFLDQACGRDARLRDEVEALLLHLQETGEFAAQGAPAAAAIGEQPGTIVGRYKLLQLLGEGGFGSVFMAEQEQPVRRRVALKIIKLGMDTRQVVARFEQERQALALMDHPNIARVLDAGATDTGRPYFVMELVKGEPITAYCDRHNLNVRERLELFIQVCQAVQHAHHKGVIHRDLKPGNVLVYTHEGKPLAKVIDFGIAKAADYRMTEKTIFTEQRQLIGTPAYMSPEQAEGTQDIDTRTDVYSLGVLLYELLTGSTPFDTKSLRSAAYAEIQRIIREVEPEKPSTRVASLDDTAAIAAHRRTDPGHLSRSIRGDLDWVVMKALDKDRARRYDSPSALAQDLDRYLRDEPVAAGPPSAAYKIRKFVRRHRAGAAATAAFLALLVGALAVTAVLYQRADAERQRAETESARADEQRRQAEAASTRADEQRRLAEEASGRAEARRLEAQAASETADEQRKRALAEAAKVKAAYEFVSGMFSAIDPASAKGRDVPVREVLDTAAAKIETTQQPPEVEGNIREAIGEGYFHIARYPEAEKNLRRAWETRRGSIGPDAPDTLTSLFNLGAVLLELDRSKEAIDLIRESAEARARTLGPRHADTLASRSLLAYAMQLNDDLPGAEVAIREVIAAQTETLGPTHHDTIESRNSLADVLHSEGKIDEAVTAATEVAADSARVLGDDNPLTMDARSILGAALKDAGREADAEPVMRAVVEAKTRVYGPDKPGTLLSRDVLGNTLRYLKKYDEAAEIGRAVVEASTKVNGPEHTSTLVYMNNLAQTLRLAGKFDQAEPIYRQVVDIRTRTQGPDGRDTLIATYNLSLLMLDRNQPEQALPLLKQVTAGFERTLPAGHWMTASVRVSTGEALTDLSRFDEAEPLLTGGYETIAKSLGPANPRTLKAAKSVATLYSKWNKPDQAAAWEAKAAPPKKEVPK